MTTLLPDEILNLRTPVYRLFNDNKDSSSSPSPSLLIFDHIRQHLKGGAPVEKLAMRMLSEDLIKENSKALDELKSFVDMYLEMVSRNTTKSHHQNNKKISPTPPSSQPPVHSSASSITNSPARLHLLSSSRVAKMSTSQQQEQLLSNTDNHNSQTTLEISIANILSSYSSEELNDFDCLKKKLAPQIEPLLVKEHSSLLADAEDVRRMIAKPKNIQDLMLISSNMPFDYDEDDYEFSTSLSSSQVTIPTNSNSACSNRSRMNENDDNNIHDELHSSPSSESTVARPTSARKSGAIPRPASATTVSSSSSSSSPYHLIMNLAIGGNGNSGVRPGSKTSFTSDEHQQQTNENNNNSSNETGSSLSARYPSRNTNNTSNNSSNGHRDNDDHDDRDATMMCIHNRGGKKGAISELTTSRVRSVLLAKMNRSNDDDDGGKEEGKEAPVKKEQKKKTKMEFGLEVTDDDEDAEDVDDGADDLRNLF